MDAQFALVCLASAGLVLCLRWLLPYLRVLHVISWGEHKGRIGTFALLLAVGLQGLMMGNEQNAYLVFAFAPYLATHWLRERRGEFPGQSIFLALSWLLAGVGLQGEVSFLDRLALPEVPSVMLTAGLVALVTTGFSRLVCFRGAASWWMLVGLLNLSFLSGSIQSADQYLWFASLVVANGLWSVVKKQDDVDSWGAGWLGFWLATNSLTLELSGSGGRDLILWVLLMAMPLVESISGWNWSGGSRPSTGVFSFIPHLRGVGFHHRQAIMYLCGLGLFSGLTSWTLLEAREDLLYSLVACMGVTGLGLFVGFTYLIRHHKQNHVERMSQTLLQRYLNLEKKVAVDMDKFQAVAYDLLPYYRRLEELGIGEVQGFLHDFAEFLRQRHPEYPALMVGSYTVLVVEDRIEPPGRYLTDLNRDFFAFLEQHKLSPAASPSYFSSQSKQSQFLERFGHLIDSRLEDPDSEVA